LLPHLVSLPLFLQPSSPPRHPHSLPTRRSSDLGQTFATGTCRMDALHLGTGESPVINRDFIQLPHKTRLPRTFSNLKCIGCAKRDRKSTRLNSSHEWISYAVFCLKKKRRTGISW